MTWLRRKAETARACNSSLSLSPSLRPTVLSVFEPSSPFLEEVCAPCSQCCATALNSCKENLLQAARTLSKPGGPGPSGEQREGSRKGQAQTTEVCSLGVLLRAWCWALASLLTASASSELPARAHLPTELWDAQAASHARRQCLMAQRTAGDTHSSCSFWQKLQPSRLMREMELLPRWSWCRAVRP